MVSKRNHRTFNCNGIAFKWSNREVEEKKVIIIAASIIINILQYFISYSRRTTYMYRAELQLYIQLNLNILRYRLKLFQALLRLLHLIKYECVKSSVVFPIKISFIEHTLPNTVRNSLLFFLLLLILCPSSLPVPSIFR